LHEHKIHQMELKEVEKYRFDHMYLRMMAEQTEKDFARIGFEFTFKINEPPDFYDFCLQLEPKLMEWCKEDRQKLMGVMYHIDMPDHLLKEGINCKDCNALAKQILQRELIKVVIRKQYSL